VSIRPVANRGVFFLVLIRTDTVQKKEEGRKVQLENIVAGKVRQILLSVLFF
jgi:hypothetical protein